MLQNCHDIMTKNPEACLASDKVITIAKRLQSENIGALPVVENYRSMKLIGIVTDRDLALRVLAASLDAHNTSVSEIMSSNTVVCHPEDDLDMSLELMARHQIRRIPIVNRDTQLVGIIAQADIATRHSNPIKISQVIEQISLPD